MAIRNNRLTAVAAILKTFATLSSFPVALVLWTGCGVAQDPAPAGPEERFPITLGGQTLHVELAVTQEEHARGLMYREELESDAGMLFVFRSPAQRHFYMKNTPLPLDIGYFSSEGVLLEVYALHPFDENTVASRSSEVRFALETNQGWFPAHGIRRGARLDLGDVADALRQRGFNPAEFGL